MPVHATLRVRAGLPSLRGRRVFATLAPALSRASRGGFRILHYSAQSNHVHLLVEADDHPSLVRGLQGLAIRLAKAVNRAVGRRGSVWRDRYHAQWLRTPRMVRNALVYVLANVRKHQPGFRGLDPCSSACWFTGWKRSVACDWARSPVAAPHTWLARIGWKRNGLVGPWECPAAPQCRARSKRTSQRPRGL